jgi:hypothetical protein
MRANPHADGAGKTWFITGSARGQGAEIVEAALAAGTKSSQQRATPSTSAAARHEPCSTPTSSGYSPSSAPFYR